MFKFISFVLVISLMIVFGSRHLPAVVENREQRDKKPPLRVKRIVGEFLAGVVVGGFLGAYIPLLVIPSVLGGGEFAGPFTLFFIVPITYSLSSAIGVYLVGNGFFIGNERGSFLATLGGGFLGMLVGISATRIATWVGQSAVAYFTAPIGMALIGAIIGFNLTHRYKSSTSNG